MDFDSFKKEMEELHSFYIEIHKIIDFLEMQPENKIVNLYFKMFETIKNYISEKNNDKFSWIDWFIYDNEFGKKGFEAGYKDKKVQKIKNLEQLFNLIQEGKKKKLKK